MKNKANIIQQLLIFYVLINSNYFLAQAEYDIYGGRVDLPIKEGTGFFNLGKIGDKDFLVTPEGHAFKAIGVNHTHMVNSGNYDKIIENIKSLGFNSGDYQGPHWMWHKIPHTKGVNLLETSIWLSRDKLHFVDVFDSQFLKTLEAKINRTVTPQVNNKMLIAYFLTDVPVWNIKKKDKGWIDFFKSLNKDAPGKIAFEKWKKENPNKPEDNFIPIIARQIYSKGTEFIKKYDKNHLIFSDRYYENHFPKKVAQEALPFVDGIAIQPKNFLDFSFFDDIYKTFKKPIFIADHVTSYATKEHSNTMGQVATNVKDYFKYYSKSVNQAMSKPYIVGYNKCQYKDEIKKTQLKQGLYNVKEEPYPYVRNLKEIHQSAIKKAYAVPKVAKHLDSYGLQDWGPYETVKQEAVNRIEKNRKGNIHLKIKLPNNKIASNVKVKAILKKHKFKWGAVVKESFANSPYSEKYKEIFLKYFNASGFTVALKPKFRNSPREKTAENIIMPWFLDNDIYVRGHTLVWEGFNFMRPEDKAVYKNPALSDKEKGEQLLESCSKHFYHAIPKWNVNCWDVSNESLANNTINNLLPNTDTHVGWFKLADSLRTVYNKKNVVLYQNDYQVISGIAPWVLNFRKKGYKGVGRVAVYRETLEKQIALGAPIEGIGFQSRIKYGKITPDTIYNRLCNFDKFNLPYQATEFEIRDVQKKYVYTDEERRLITEYMMIMYFSHAKVNGFWHWTFADGRKENLDYPLFNFDGTPKVNGEKWIELMEGFLNTEEIIETTASGEIDLRGYFGNYEIIAEVNKKLYTGTFVIDTGINETQEVNLEMK